MVQFRPVEEQLALIRRGTEKILPEEELVGRLKQSRETGVPLRVKYGIDPTGVDVHLGHTVPMRKMRQFQELGHQAVIIIGDYTARVGDPSGRDSTRARLTGEQVDRNAATYLAQLGRVLDLSKAEVVRNGDWFARMSFAELLELCGKVTIAQLLTRDDFAKRMQSESPIFLHECLYPVMQAWDSVMVRADVELGGTEQLYSFMLARDLQRAQQMPSQIALMMPILVGLDGVRRMGKSLGNYIGIGEPPYEMMKKFMQVPDAAMPMYFELLTDVPLDDARALIASDPKQAKLTLGRAVISQYHGEVEANAAAEQWEREVGQGGVPTDIPEATLARSELDAEGRISALGLLKGLELCTTTSEAIRLIDQGGAYLYHGSEKIRIESGKQMLSVTTGMIIRAGKKKACRVRIVP
ncbi:MAG TPA: tyrosine--tRNA ligase [Planctomycetaceae bacterium]|nr:tyrosine--tRNA ligase [Planctomycetaceae bacterium]